MKVTLDDSVQLTSSMSDKSTLRSGRSTTLRLEIIEAIIMADSLDNVEAYFLAKWAR
ncbi:hypothetical protein QQ045_027266 [Rhodiola kirilowii]